MSSIKSYTVNITCYMDASARGCRAQVQTYKVHTVHGDHGSDGTGHPGSPSESKSPAGASPTSPGAHPCAIAPVRQAQPEPWCGDHRSRPRCMRLLTTAVDSGRAR